MAHSANTYVACRRRFRVLRPVCHFASGKFKLHVNPMGPVRRKAQACIKHICTQSTDLSALPNGCVELHSLRHWFLGLSIQYISHNLHFVCMLAARSSSCISAKATTKHQVSPLCYAEVYSVALSCLNLIRIAIELRSACSSHRNLVHTDGN